MIGEKTKQSSISKYQPSQDVLDITSKVQEDFFRGHQILHKPRNEFNGYSLIQRMNKDRRTFQSYVDESAQSKDEEWKWKGTRGTARKKAIAMHAHMTSGTVVPNVFPQNKSQEEDRKMARVMKDIVEWQTENSNYRRSYLGATLGMLANPVSYIQADYYDVPQTIKENIDNGYVENEIQDEELSGVNCEVLSADQVLITNAYEQNIQRQKAIIERRHIDYSEAKAKYSDHPNFAFVQRGTKVMFNEDDGLFYDIKDDENTSLVQEVIWKSRRGDWEIPFVNGIYLGDKDVDWNSIRHRDNRNAPKYNIVPFGYHRINEHFYYYASLMFEVGWDDKLIDAMYEVTMNREFLDLEQPVMISGVENVNTSVVFPGAVHSTENPNAKVQPVIPPRQGTPYKAMQEVEDSVSESSLSDVKTGQLPEATQKAFNVARAETNAKILLSGAMNSLGESVSDLGNLLIDIALQHLTTAQFDEITGAIKYRDFILNDQKVNGKKVSKKIRFDESLMGRKMDEDDRRKYLAGLLKESGYPEKNQEIYVVNPHLFSKMDYKAQIRPDQMTPKNEQFERMMAQSLYGLLRNDPLIDSQTLVRKLVYAFSPQDGDELVKEADIDEILQKAAVGGQQPQQQQQNVGQLPAQ